MQLAALAQSGAPGWSSPSASFGALLFLGLWSSLLEVPTQALLWHTWRGEGGPLSLASLKTGPGKQWRDTRATTCSSARNMLPALEQDIPSGAPETFIAR